jgi:ABC-2 type transport system ATP-binding protein
LKQGRIAAHHDLEAERKANRKFIELETRGEQVAFANAVEQLGCEYAITSKQRMKLILDEQVEIRDLYKLAHQHELQIRGLNFKRDSLEDIFLKAMEA